MSSQAQHDQESEATPEPGRAETLGDSSGATPTDPPVQYGRTHRRWPVVVLAILLVLTVAGGVYVTTLAQAWQDRAAEVDAIARDLGGDLAETRAELEETQGTLALVESQLDGAQEQIHELANTAAQFGDDREIQRQVVEYQAELFDAATGVTGTMGECISAQTEYTLALEEELGRTVELLREQDADEEPTPDADEEPDVEDEPAGPGLQDLRNEVVDACQAAAEAHESLQQRLGDS